MKINDDVFQRRNLVKVITDLENLLEQPSEIDTRPCPDCEIIFPGNPSIQSTAHCSPDCPHAALKMSSDPERYPIEPGILPLVYALYTIRLIMPCWSCEGHLDGNHNITRLPGIWFYSASDLYPKLIASLLSDLYGYHEIKNDWQVSILPFSQSVFTVTYSIEPRVTDINQVSLNCLHEDVKIIAKNLRNSVFDRAEKHLESIR